MGSRATLRIMDAASANDISSWRYDGPYAQYNFHRDADTLWELMDGSYYAVEEAGFLIGYYCFGGSARIPVREQDVYKAGPLDLGLGLRPELCGRGLGRDFLAVGIAFAQEQLRAPSLRLTVAAFNQRAIRLYTHAGFVPQRTLLHARTGQAYLLMQR